MKTLAQGERVRIAAVKSVCEYLHGAECVVEEVGFSRDFDGKPLHRVRLIEPRKPCEHWTPIELLGVRADQLEGV